MYKHYIKRIFDFCFAVIAIICLSPVFIILTFLLFIANNDRKAFFYQERAGLNARNFYVIKFKSMSDEKDPYGNLLPDAERLTSIGKFVRATSLDELPQLFNILKGDMSLIGPRPLLPQYVPLYDSTQRRRLEVRPGITGWAQIHGRNGLKLSKRFEYDVYYVDHLTFKLDLKIFFLTFKSLCPSKVVVDRGDLNGVDDLDFDRRAFGENRKKR